MSGQFQSKACFFISGKPVGVFTWCILRFSYIFYQPGMTDWTARTGIFITVFYLKERGLQTWQIDVCKIRFLLHFNLPILVNIL